LEIGAAGVKPDVVALAPSTAHRRFGVG